ncbi:MAG: hypothetical protein JWR05_2194 [Mucilaginibacter sp.]|nr:hypothetical protein [Mucilaginibacter sp.]
MNPSRFHLVADQVYKHITMDLSKIKWLYNRFKIMSRGEVVFRAGQAIQKYKEKTFPKVPVHKSFAAVPFFFDPTDALAFPSPDLSVYHFFGLSLDIESSIDFHKDIFSGKSFPLVFSKSIDTRTSKFGDAKVVWEINRLQFLLPILLEYRKTGNSQHLSRFVSIMTDWDSQNPYMIGVNWYSNIEVNVRLINWYWCWILLDNDPVWQSNTQYQQFKNEVWIPLIYKHCVYSNNNPSYYSSANNHLISEYAGLFVASTLWHFPESKQWQHHSLKGLEKEIILQHSTNGINKEEAAEYIQFITDFFLVPYVISQHQNISFSKNYTDTLTNICKYIYNFIDAKGNYPKYGDDDDGKIIVPSCNTHDNNFLSILNTAVVLLKRPEFKLPGNTWDIKSALLTAHINGTQKWGAIQPLSRKDASVFYEKEGHFFFRKTTQQGEIYFHFDAASLGFLSLAAHGHADALSVILNVDGCAFLVDPGTYTYYQNKEWRKYFVNTSVHNTVSFDQINQANHVGAMMWLDHFTCKLETLQKNNDKEIVSASHDGYKRIGAKHSRTIEFNRLKNTIVIKDEIEAADKVNNAILHWHLHPLVNIAPGSNKNEFVLSHPETNRKVILNLPNNTNEIVIQDGWYSDSFLKKASCKIFDCFFNITNREVVLQTTIKIID